MFTYRCSHVNAASRFRDCPPPDVSANSLRAFDFARAAAGTIRPLSGGSPLPWREHRM